MSASSPPAFARILVVLLFRGEGKEFVLGDMEEEFNEDVLPALGRSAARRWYWRQATGTIVASWKATGRRAERPAYALRARPRSFWQDISYAWRVLRAKPGLTAAAVITLGLGIGPTTAMFSLANWLLLRPVSGVQDQGQLAIVWFGRSAEGGGITISFVSYPNLADLVTGVPAFSGLAGHQGSSIHFAAANRAPETRPSEYVTDNYFSVLGVQPQLGRVFTQGEGTSPDASVVVLSHALWTDWFNRDPGVLGQIVYLNGLPFSVIGVASEGFEGTIRFGGTELWLPGPSYYRVNHFPDPFTIDDRGSGGFYEFVARLAPGATFEQARSQLEAATLNLAEAYPDVNEQFSVVRPFLFPGIGLPPLGAPTIRSALRLLIGLIGLILLITCANVANLLLFRGATRRGESAVRKALGASTFRLLRQHLTESVMLAIMGGVVGILLAIWLKELLGGLALRGLRVPLDNIPFDWVVLAFTLVVCLGTGVLFGIIPAIAASRVDLATSLKDSVRTETAKRPYLRRGLSVVQMAASLALLIGALLFTRTLRNITRVELGFDPSNVVTFQVNPGDQGYTQPETQQYVRDLVARLSAHPGVEAVSVSTETPFGSSFGTSIYPAGADPDNAVRAGANTISPGYFEVLRMPVVRGSGFEERQQVYGARERGVVVLSERMADILYPNQDPLGRYVTLSTRRGQQESQVVGVVGDVVWRDPTEPIQPMVYELFGQDYPISYPQILVRSRAEAVLAAGVLRDIASGIDRTLPLTGIEFLTDRVRDRSSQQRLFALVVSLLSLLALILAAVGLYGLVAQSVAERTREFGIRMAMGAQRNKILAMVVRQGTVLGLIGVGGGVGASYALQRVVEARMFGVSATDPLTYVVSAAALLIIAVVASWIPARLATRVDPVVALRHQ